MRNHMNISIQIVCNLQLIRIEPACKLFLIQKSITEISQEINVLSA